MSQEEHQGATRRKSLRAQVTRAGPAETSCWSCAASSSTCAWQRATGQAVKPDQFSKVRRNIARLKTVQREQRARSSAEE